MACQEQDCDFLDEDMEVLDSSQEECNGNDGIRFGETESAEEAAEEAVEYDPLEVPQDEYFRDKIIPENDGSEYRIDLFVEAHEREFKNQKKDKPLDLLHVQANSQLEFEQQVWVTYGTYLRKEIIYQRAEEGVEELLQWSPTRPVWADRDRFFLVQNKRSTAQLSELTNDFLEGLRGCTIRMSVLVYSTSLISAKDFERAKVVLGLGKRSSGLKDRAGSDSNQSVQILVGDLKARHKHRYVKPLDVSFVLRANHIQGSAAYLRDDLIAGSPPEHLKNLFLEVDESGAQSLLDSSMENTTIAETVNESVEFELKEIEAACDKVESSVAELRLKIQQFKVCVRERKSLLSAFKRSLKITEGSESTQIAKNIVDIPDMDHE